MNYRSRQVIAVTLVAAALCADRVAVAAPVLRPQAATAAAESLVSRLTSSFRRVVRSVKVIETRREDASVKATPLAPESVIVAPRPVTPFQFRLPPPIQ